MAIVDSLPADQRAVLALVLQRGRSYDEIATMLSIDRTAVRGRALAALQVLGGATDLSPSHVVVLSDYLLGQLPAAAAEQSRSWLADDDAQQRWARTVATELASLSSAPLAAIPRPTARPSSRRGGAVLLAFVAVVAVASVVVVLTGRGSTAKQTAATHAQSTTARTTTRPSAGTTTTSTTATTAHIIAQVNLLSPNSSYPNAVGVAQVVRAGTRTGMVLVAQGMPANPANEYYAVWLSNTPADSRLLGFLPERVGTSGKLQADSLLGSSAARYSKLLVTLETEQKPTEPGTVVLEGALNLG